MTYRPTHGRTKSDIVHEVAQEKGWPVHEIKLVGIGPEFEVMRPPAPTYEQAIVNMFREAKGILEVGERLKKEMFIARDRYLSVSTMLRCDRMNGSPLEHAYFVVGKALDELWFAQEKYKAWAATYGDI